MKLVAAMRLVLATALLFLVSGTMAFAHEGHHHGGQMEQVVSNANPSAFQYSSHFSSLLAAKASEPKFADLHNGATVSVASDFAPASDCGHGCCCCGGAFACGMAGCAAFALSGSEEFAPRPLHLDKLTFMISDVRAGRDVSGLDRPPKA